jgi:hypothetical protein
VILTDLESTNGTKVNGKTVQIRRLRPGDQIGIGRSLLRFGSDDEIRVRMATLAGLDPVSAASGSAVALGTIPVTMPANPNAYPIEPEFDFTVKTSSDVARSRFGLIGPPLPPLPQKMSPAQAARVAEILDLLHRGLSAAIENIEADDEGATVTFGFADWQRILNVQMLLAMYLRAVTEPDALAK